MYLFKCLLRATVLAVIKTVSINYNHINKNYLITISITTAKTVINKNVEGDLERVPQSTWSSRSQQSSPWGE